MDPFHSNLPRITCLGLVDGSKTKDTQPTRNLPFKGIQSMSEWKVHVAQHNAKGGDWALGACPRGWNKFIGPLCVRLQHKVDYHPF